MSGVDFAALEARARTMRVEELHYARLDAVRAAEAMDRLDRALGGDRAGRYRDEASVYRGELRRRSTK